MNPVRPIDPAVAQRLHARIDMLAQISEEPDRLTRSFLSPAMRRAAEQFAGWCRETGLSPHIDGVGNVRATWSPAGPGRPRLVLGSHLDTVRDAGKYDGPLGVVAGLACIEQLQAGGETLPFDLEVVGFADEEGLRFHTAYLGSSYYAGIFPAKWFELADRAGRTMAQALAELGQSPSDVFAAQRVPENVCGYLELHIEQGPLLEVEKCAAGVVSAIAAQMRANLLLTGKAGHAGTTPMDLRRDALAGAAEIIVMIENIARQTPRLRATVGHIDAKPGASNVIPVEARFTLDIRHPQDDALAEIVQAVHAQALAIAERRRLHLRWDFLQQTKAVPMDATLCGALAEAADRAQGKAPVIVSGAGHDAVIMSTICPVGMLFVRCREGLSHHPDEYVQPADLETALAIFVEGVRLYAARFARMKRC